MKMALTTLCLNEMEWLPKLYAQHRDWPNLESWVFVEAADATYAQINPHLVSPAGLSVDGTSEWLRDLAKEDSRVKYIPFGLSRHPDPALCKIPARQSYLDYLENVKPHFFVVLDADEFYCRHDQRLMNDRVSNTPGKYRHFCFGFTHIWHPQSLASEPLFRYEVVGGFWNIPHTKGVRWDHGLKYTGSHQRCDLGNDPGRMCRFPTIKCFHMAFASDPDHRAAKHRYYEGRGEAGSKRDWYVESRKAYEEYQPNMTRLPRGARVVLYRGPVPEVFA